MKIIEDGRAPNPRRVRIFMAEKMMSVPLEPIDIMKGEHKTAAFTSLNPMQKVPVLVLDDGQVIAESMAICRYFEALQPQPPLFGTDALSTASVEMWNRRMEFELLFPVMQMVRHLVPAMAVLEQPQVPAWGEANRERVMKMLHFINGELQSRPFIAGQAFTVADITALVAVDFMRVARLARPPELSHLGLWHERVSSRPSARA